MIINVIIPVEVSPEDGDTIKGLEGYVQDIAPQWVVEGVTYRVQAVPDELAQSVAHLRAIVKRIDERSSNRAFVIGEYESGTMEELAAVRLILDYLAMEVGT